MFGRLNKMKHSYTERNILRSSKTFFINFSSELFNRRLIFSIIFSLFILHKLTYTNFLLIYHLNISFQLKIDLLKLSKTLSNYNLITTYIIIIVLTKKKKKKEKNSVPLPRYFFPITSSECPVSMTR